MNNYLHILGILSLLLIIIPVILGYLAVVISRKNKGNSILLGGFYGQVIFGGIGVIIHELSHLIMAIIFHHHIESFQLLHIPRNPDDRGLGYVSHVWNDESTYQKIGNVFIGVAPVIGCSLVMLLSTRYLVPGVYNEWLLLVNQPQISVSASSWWQWLIWIVLMVNISIGGFDLSGADLQNSRQGLVALIIILLVTAGILTIFMDYQTIYQDLSHFMMPFYLILGFAIAVNAVLWLIMLFFVHLSANH